MTAATTMVKLIVASANPPSWTKRLGACDDERQESITAPTRPDPRQNGEDDADPSGDRGAPSEG
jgi:hypothetical protein